MSMARGQSVGLFVVALATFLGVAVAVPIPSDVSPDFDAWALAHGKVYADETQRAARAAVFRANAKAVGALNAESEGCVYALNKFADMSAAEFKRTVLMDMPPFEGFPLAKVSAPLPTNSTPASFDWRDHNAVTDVKNQGALGTCWAFSTVGNIEGQLAVKHGKLESLSVEEIAECDNTDCYAFGGWPYKVRAAPCGVASLVSLVFPRCFEATR